VNWTCFATPRLVTIKTTIIIIAVNAGIPNAIQRRMSW